MDWQYSVLSSTLYISEFITERRKQAQLAHQRVLLADQRRPIQAAGLRMHAGEGTMPSPVVGLGGPDQRLGGHAADVDARAAQDAGLDDDSPLAQPGRLDGRRPSFHSVGGSEQ